MTKTLPAGTKKTFRKVVVEGIAMYASVHAPKKGYSEEDAPQYTLDLIVDDTTAETLFAEGLKVAKKKLDEDTKIPKVYDSHPGMKVFNFRRKTTKKDGEVLAPPEVVDSSLRPVPKTTLIGNGSKVRVSINPYTTTIKGKEVTGHTLLGVQVLELVPYVANIRPSNFSKTTGFTVPSEAAFTDVNVSSNEDENPFD